MIYNETNTAAVDMHPCDMTTM